jgi:nucleoid-associated protein YgaU
MSKIGYDNITKPVRKRSAVTGTLVGVRLQADQIKAVDAWASKQKPPVTRPEAIRGIIELGLTVKAKATKQPSATRAVRAKELATKAIDKMVDPAAPPEERAHRRRRLTNGPLEFRENRVDLPKANGK